MLSSMALTEKDLLTVQAAYPGNRVELRDGKIIIMSPSGHAPEVIVARLTARLQNWIEPRGLGFVATSSAGFHLPNGDVIAPDVSYVSKRKMPVSPPGFAHVVPDLVVEVKSPSDRIAELEAKLSLVRTLGAEVTWLIDPEKRTVTVDADGQAPFLVTDIDVLELPTLLPGWSMRVSELWPPRLEYSS